MAVIVVLLIAGLLAGLIDAQCDPTVTGNQLRDCPMTSYDGSSGTIDLYLMPFVFNTVGSSYMTRAYAGSNKVASIPGPVIHLKQNRKLKITLHNMLGADQVPKPKNTMNGLFEPNTTNLHTHGLHVGAEEPQDNVELRIMPGDSYPYEYDIGAHGSGTFFYHPHAHGAVTDQLGGGAYGMLIVDDEATNSPYDFIKQMPEIQVSIWNFAPLSQALVASDSDDTLFAQISGITQSKLMVVNGFIQPNIKQNAGQWYRWRVQYTSTASTLTATLTGCQFLLLALDGVWLNAPRSVSQLQFFQPSRIDVAVNCPAGGPYNLIDASMTGTPVLTVSIDTIAESAPTVLDLTQWSNPRPDYLQDTTTLTANDLANSSFVVSITGTETRLMNGQSFAGFDRSNALHYMKPNTVEEFTLDVQQHPLHIHISPYQLQADSPDGYYKAGDWLDTYMANSAMRVRSRIGNFNGPVVMHCHVSVHADQGLTGIMWIDGVSQKRVPGKSYSAALVPSVVTVFAFIATCMFILA